MSIIATMLRKLRANLGPDAWRTLGASGALSMYSGVLRSAPALLRTRSLAPLDRAMRGRVAVRGRGDPRGVVVDLEAYRPLDLAEGSMAFGGIREIWIRDVYLAPFELPPRLDAVVDLGANRGLFSLRLAARAQMVVAVEAQAHFREPMERVLRDNGLDNVRLLHAFVGAPGKFDAGATPKVSLAEVLNLCAGHAIDLIKIDIEGSEFGLDPVSLARAKRLALEVHPGFGSPQALVTSLEASGFECRCRDESGREVAPPAADFVHAVSRSCSDARWADR